MMLNAVLSSHTISDYLATAIALTQHSVPVQMAIAAEISADHNRLPA